MGKMEMTANGNEASVQGDENVLKLILKNNK